MGSTLTTRLKTRAAELGFSAAGVTSAATLQAAAQSLRERIKSGLLHDYGFLRRPPESFTRPADLLPGALSVVAVAWPYHSPIYRVEVGSFLGRVARFACGVDYHNEVESRLTELGKWLTAESGAKWRVCVDTSPLIDRACAREAGIGSYGKNTSIITDEAGSWVALGELVTNAKLDFDAPSPLEDCGECDICIKSCPTRAIVRPFVVDQTRCLSHITQMKGYIPQEFRTIMGDRLYGCDTCQLVCPKNADIRTEREESCELDLVSVLRMTVDEFKETIAATAMAWIGLTRLRRNAAIALGNVGDASVLPELIVALTDSEPIVRGHAAWSLAGLGGAPARRALESALAGETNAKVREEICAALAG